MDYESIKHLVQTPAGQLITTGLFAETQRRHGTTQAAPFTLADWRKVYVEIADPTEYTTAMELLGSWEHWVALRSNPVLAAHFDEWAQEVEVKLRSQGVLGMIEVSKRANVPGAAAAARWLAENGFSEKATKRTAADKEREERVKKQVHDRVADDASRLGLIQGGKKS